MASNFKIFKHINQDNLHLKLEGDFDGSSAHELINTIKSVGMEMNTISINTNGLKAIYPFGLNIFQNNLYLLNGRSKLLKYTGNKRKRIAPIQ